jgi:uncharacterized repeat protein (TIGR01451 family)
VTPAASYILRKTLNTPDPVRVGDPISFTIRITNTGSVVINTLPLTDTYDVRYLAYDGTQPAVPVADDNNDDGRLNWSDVTGAGDLTPGNHVDVVLYFKGLHDTAISGMQTSSASVRINAPTAVAIAHKTVQVVDGQTMLAWTTETETDLVAFHLWREDANGRAGRAGEPADVMASNTIIRLTATPLVAQYAGQSTGATYSYIDTTATLGIYYRYVLELIDTSGNSSYSELGSLGAQHSLYLPVMRR